MTPDQKPTTITEWDVSEKPRPEGATDEHLLADADAAGMTWDLATENPPHAGYTGYLPHPERQKPE
jgi:hypothetical protein